MNITTDIKFQLILGIAVMLLLFVSVLLAFIIMQNKKYEYHNSMQELRETQQNQLIEAAVRSEENERHRISEELHDEVGAILSSAKLYFQNIKIDEREANSRLYDKGHELLDYGLEKVRGISHRLHSNVLKEFGLNEAIQHFTQKITMGTVIQASTTLDGAYATMHPENDISIFRIVQEFINNILKHALAKNIHISSVCADNTLNVTITHDGDGITQKQFDELQYKKEGLGLKNIKNRIILLKGGLLFTAVSDVYNILIKIPLNTDMPCKK